MTTTALENAPWSTLEQERGVSADAHTLRLQWERVVAASETITRGLALDEIRARIHGAVRDARLNESIRVEEGTIRYAEAFATALPRALQEMDISVDCDGDIAFDWDFGSRRVFAVSVRRDGILHYAGVFGANRSHGSEVLFRGIPAPVVHGIQRAKRGG